MPKEFWVVLGVGAALLGSVGVTLLATRDIPALEEAAVPDTPAGASEPAPVADPRPARPGLDATRPPAVQAIPPRVAPRAIPPPSGDRGQ